MAGSLAFKNAVEKANPILLEPIMNVTITVPEDCVGDVSADFNQRRGKILNMDAGGPGYRVISANVPMGELYNYAVDLDSMTKGDAEYVEKLEKYEPVPANIASSIISKNKES
jgi:elongation factor G